MNPSNHAGQVRGEHALLDTVQVGAGAEGGWRTREHDHTGVGMGGLGVEQGQQRVVVDGVATLRAIEGDQHHPVADIRPNFDPNHDGNCTVESAPTRQPAVS